MSFIIFLKKEIIELVKTVKGVVLAVIFLFIGISAPLIAKLLPEILKLAATDAETQEVMDALAALMPPPNSLESYNQFFSNFSQIGLIALIIIFAGIVANEKSKNTASYILTKNISRAQFIMAKFTSSVIFNFVSLIITAAVFKLYTDLLFEDKLVDFESFIIFFAFLLLYIFFILSIVLFSSILSKNITSATFIAFLIFIIFNIATVIPKVGRYMPPQINNIGIINQSVNAGDLTVNIIVTVLCSAAFIFGGIKLFNRQEL
jgi:ABC-2 type transport system permease protein